MAHRLVTVARRLERLLQRGGMRRAAVDPLWVGQQLSKMESPHTPSLLQQWYNFCQRPPRGFEKYFRGAAGKQAKQGQAKKEGGQGEAAPPPPAQSKGPPPPTAPKDPFSMNLFGSGTKNYHV
ncbi:hypothetical protein GWK47_047979 [Chionoecetes opilio]|uniref:Uncharacterized protein n=1 Tax=Chionoecetes opilio TaxID=41210 RepID=A0A8J4YG24_CHIOP|nr:hypothetical protein GWK47_047979 [Chionoecetes opilio]